MNRWTDFCHYLLDRHPDLSVSQPEGRNYLRLVNQNHAHVALGHRRHSLTLRLVLDRPHWSEEDARRTRTSVERRMLPVPAGEHFDDKATHGEHRWVVQLVRALTTDTAPFQVMERWYLERSFVFLRAFYALQGNASSRD